MRYSRIQCIYELIMLVEPKQMVIDYPLEQVFVSWRPLLNYAFHLQCQIRIFPKKISTFKHYIGRCLESSFAQGMRCIHVDRNKWDAIVCMCSNIIDRLTLHIFMHAFNLQFTKIKFSWYEMWFLLAKMSRFHIKVSHKWFPSRCCFGSIETVWSDICCSKSRHSLG